MTSVYRLVAAGAISVAVLLSAGACGGSTPTASAPVPTPTTSVAATSTAATTTTPTSTPTTRATATSTAKATAAPTTARGGSVKCGVTSATLFSALRLDRSMYEKAGSPSALKAPVCVPGFAAAKDVDTASGGEPGYVLFRADPATGIWTPANVGTSDYCVGYVPADVANTLPGCGG